MASPFKKNSPLNAYKYSLTSQYANPRGVIQPIVEAEAAKAIGDASKKVLGVYSKIESDKKPEPRKKAEIAGAITPGRGEVKSRGFSKAGELTSITDQKIKMIGQKDKVTEKQAWENRDTNKYPPGSEKKFVKDMQSDPLYGTSGGKGISTTLESTSIYGDGNLISKSPYNKKGSPAKHNESAVGSIAGAQPQSSAISIAGSMLGGKSMAEIKAIGQKPTDSAQGGGGVFGAAARAIGSTGAFGEPLPPPNQVTESGSYAGTGDRMLEMDSNPIGNQSIGRNTDVASQLFGSGQRASMLAMKGTPLQNAGHGEKQAHSHPSKTTTKMKPDGEYPGAKYVKGDYVDQDVLDKTDLDVHISTLYESDKKGTFIKEKPDSGPGSDIQTAKGFGKKIRLNNIARPSYTSNEGDQLDPHKFLFQKTPKK